MSYLRYVIKTSLGSLIFLLACLTINTLISICIFTGQYQAALDIINSMLILRKPCGKYFVIK